jgi:hypothetical protein
VAEPIDIRIMFDEDDFRTLVAGGVVKARMKVRGSRALVQIGLKDIGWDRMTMALRDAIEENKVEPFADAGEFFANMPGAGERAEGETDGTQDPS